MFNDSKETSLSDHSAWMEREIFENRSVFLIAESDGSEVGFVRFTKAASSKDFSEALKGIENLWFVSLGVSPERRGQGIGGRMFRMAQSEFLLIEDARPLNLMTWARNDNPASWAIFLAAGWHRVVIPDFREVVWHTIAAI